MTELGAVADKFGLFHPRRKDDALGRKFQAGAPKQFRIMPENFRLPNTDPPQTPIAELDIVRVDTNFTAPAVTKDERSKLTCISAGDDQIGFLVSFKDNPSTSFAPPGSYPDKMRQKKRDKQDNQSADKQTHPKSIILNVVE